MKEHGESREAVLEEITRIRRKDAPWDRVLNSICSKPLDIGCEAYRLGLETNLGDARIFPATYALEKKVIGSLGLLLHSGKAVGNIVSGGTEANLMALHNAMLMKKVRKPEIILPETAHFSLSKIAALLNLKVRTARVDEKHRAVAEDIERLINENTIAIVAAAGSSEFGSIDPVKEIAKIAVKRQIYLHVDAATGGFIIPFANRLGYGLPEFDFGVEGVSSVTIDPHKYGLTPIASGAVLFKDAKTCENLSNPSFFIGTPAHRTFLGTRSGAGVYAVYAVMRHLGEKGFTLITRENFEKTRHLTQRLRQNGFALYMEPELNIVSIKVRDSAGLVKKMEEAGYIISASKRAENVLRIVIQNHVSFETLDSFAALLKEADNKNF